MIQLALEQERPGLPAPGLEGIAPGRSSRRPEGAPPPPLAAVATGAGPGGGSVPCGPRGAPPAPFSSFTFLES